MELLRLIIGVVGMIYYWMTMGIRILVSGLLPFDSGKTTVARILIEGLRERGVSIGVSKPIAGHSLWYQHGSISNIARENMLVGEDAVVLRDSAGSKDPLPMINPLDIGTLPPDPEQFISSLSVYYDHVGTTLRSAIISRVSRCNGDKVSYRHFVISDNLRVLNRDLRASFNRLLNYIKGEVEEVAFGAFERIVGDAVKHAERCLDTLYSMHENLLIESFNDASAPTVNSLNVDLVVVAAPGKVFVYEGDLYRRAFYVTSSIVHSSPFGAWSTVADLVKLIKRYHALDMPPLWDADRYGVFRERLVDLVLGYSDQL